MTAYRHENSGFLSQKRRSPSSLAIVIALHGAAIAAAFLVKSGYIPIDGGGIIEVVNIRPVDPPAPLPDAPDADEPQQLPAPTDSVVRQRDDHIVIYDPVIPPPPAPPPPPPNPVIVEARFSQQYLGTLQPPYPPGLLRREIEGSVTVRVRIGADGRVKAVEQVRTDHPDFFEATRRHALRRWRFLPATRDGQPIESWQQHTVVFEIR
jgi:protein TonB